MKRKISPEEAERIAKQYNVAVPEDLTVTQVPRGVGATAPTMPRKEIVKMMGRIYKRGRKFRIAKERLDTLGLTHAQ